MGKSGSCPNFFSTSFWSLWWMEPRLITVSPSRQCWTHWEKLYIRAHDLFQKPSTLNAWGCDWHLGACSPPPKCQANVDSSSFLPSPWIKVPCTCLHCLSSTTYTSSSLTPQPHSSMASKRSHFTGTTTDIWDIERPCLISLVLRYHFFWNCTGFSAIHTGFTKSLVCLGFSHPNRRLANISWGNFSTF